VVSRAAGQAVTATGWWRVSALILIGVFSAFQIGKVPAGLPAISADLDLGLIGGGWVVAIFSLIAGLGGMALGIFADRFGPLRVAVAGMILSATASGAGALAETPAQLLISRSAEGFGFMLAVVAATPLIVASCAPEDRDKALGLWAAYMPAGMGTMLLISPLFISLVGWRGLWLANAALILGWAVVIRIAMGGARRRAAEPVGTRPGFGDFAALVATPGPLLLAAIFGGYAAQFLAVTAFLPLMMIDQYGMALSVAAALGALVVVVNIAGNAASGWLLTHGWSRRRLLVLSSIGMGVTAFGIYSSALVFELRYASALAFSVIAGLTPGTLFSSAPVVAPKPRLVASVTGLMLQGSAIGQVLGPPALAAAVERLGAWDYAALFTAGTAALNIILAVLFALTRRGR